MGFLSVVEILIGFIQVFIIKIEHIYETNLLEFRDHYEY
jgi:hypothetical protein